jgi:predicted transcriptional regulator
MVTGIAEDTIDLARRRPLLERAVLNLIMVGFTQVEIADLFGIRKNAVSAIKIKSRNEITEQYFEKST